MNGCSLANCSSGWHHKCNHWSHLKRLKPETNGGLIMSGSQSQSGKDAPAFLFDFDGTLIDSVYQHVLAWHEALLKAGIELSVWHVHRRIGMSGGLMVNALSRETNRRLTEQEAAQLQQWHAEAYLRQLEQVRPLPGARDLLD